MGKYEETIQNIRHTIEKRSKTEGTIEKNNRNATENTRDTREDMRKY